MFLPAFSLSPEPDTLVIEWSEYWEDQGKAVSIYFPELLEFATEYTMAISSDLMDMIGLQFDGDMNGILVMVCQLLSTQKQQTSLDHRLLAYIHHQIIF